MKNRITILGLTIILILSLNLQSISQSGVSYHWNQFRGQNRTGVSTEKLIQKDWIKTQPELIWKHKIGSGFSELIVSDGSIYTMFSDKIDSVSGFDVLVAYDEKTGKEKWRLNVDSIYIEIDGWGDGPRSTPVIDENNVYCLSGRGKLTACTKKDGKLIWHVDFVKDFGSTQPRWGFSCSPILIDNKLIIEVGGTENRGFVAFDKTNGKVIWEDGKAQAGYNSPLLTTIDGQEQLLFVNGKIIHSYNLQGDTLWTYKLPITGPIAMPLLFESDKLFFSSVHTGNLIIQIKNNRAIELLKGFTMKNDYTTSIYHEGYIYGFHVASLRCISAETGEVKWSKRGFGKGSFIQVDDKLLILSDKGKLAIAKINPEAYEELGLFQAIDASRSWTAPTFINGKVYVRNNTEMACYKLN